MYVLTGAEARCTLFTMKTNSVLVWLRLEAAAVLICAVIAYRAMGGSWLMLTALFLLPDLSMLGYLLNPRAGAWTYNVVHSSVTPIALAGVWWLVSGAMPSSLWLIWPMHIAFDRMLGFGLKYPDAFGHTHLGSLRESNS